MGKQISYWPFHQEKIIIIGDDVYVRIYVYSYIHEFSTCFFHSFSKNVVYPNTASKSYWKVFRNHWIFCKEIWDPIWAQFLSLNTGEYLRASPCGFCLQIGSQKKPFWRFPRVGVPLKSSLFIRFSLINHPFWGTPVYGNPEVSPCLGGPTSQDDQRICGLGLLHGLVHAERNLRQLQPLR